MRHWPGLLFLAIAAIPFAAMLGDRRAPAPAPGNAETLVILSPHRREVKQEYSRGFREWMARRGRRAELRWLDVGGTSKALKELESRYAANPGKPGVDVLFGGGVDPYVQGMRQGWLAPLSLPAPALSGVPAECAGFPVYDPAGHWFGAALSGFGIVYSRPLLERLRLPEPAEWEDLGRPDYHGWVGSGDPRSSGSVHMSYEIILQAYGYERGWAVLTRLCANVRRFGEGGGSAPREVAAGDVAAGLVIDQYAQTVIAAVGGDRLGFVLPQGATVINPDAIGVLRGADSPELAERFVEFVLSEDGQRLLFQPPGVNGQRTALHRLPVREALYDDPDAPASNPYRYRSAFRYDGEKGSRRWAALNDLMGVWLIDAHAELRDAWAALIRRGCPPDGVAALCRPPVSEGDLDTLAGIWEDSRRRLDVTSRWAAEARARYAALARR